jgi:FMN phosphatase YigB (HAD superfamily)
LDGSFGISAGPLLELFPPKGVQSVFWALGAAAVPARNPNAPYTAMLRSTGYVYNRNIDLEHTRIYEAQSYCGACCFADTRKLRSIRLEDELWLEHMGYASHEDTVMFHKAWLRGIKTAIATSSPMERTLRYLGSVALQDSFDELVSGYMVEKGKPEPDIYLYVAEKLGVKPCNCMVLEDSPAGILAAHRAGCLPVIIPDQDEPDKDTASLLFARADSLKAVIGLILENTESEK